MQNNDIYDELHRNFIEYAYAVNTDRAIPSALDGLKPVAKRILYSCAIEGRSSSKPHVKSARIVGDVMGKLHPHGDSSIYGAMARLSQNWVMRYPLIDWHGNNGNIVGDGPAAARYTEARLAKIAEQGLLKGLDKGIVDFIPNYDETMEEPVVLPSIFPNLLCNPNSGIGVAMACNWAPHNLREVAGAIAEYMEGKEPTLPGPDFPTGGIIINKDDIPDIMRTGHGSVKIRGKYKIEKNNIIFYEIPYGTTVEALVAQIGEVAEEINGVSDVRDETNKKGIRIVIELEKGANVNFIITQLFSKTDLQTTFSYNQVALVGKTPTELNLKDCCKIYVDHNLACLKRELEFDIKKDKNRVEVIDGLLKAIEDIDNIIALIKKSDNSTAAKDALIAKYSFTENQAKAILAMRLSSLAKLEGIELNEEREKLSDRIVSNSTILEFEPKQKEVILNRLSKLVDDFGDDRKTELTQIAITKEDKEVAAVEPEKVVVIMTESGLIKRIPASAFKAQRRGGKGIKTNDDIVNSVIRTNTVDSLMVFTNKGNMYRLLVNNIPEGNNTSPGVSVKSLVQMNPNENPAIIYSIYRDTNAKFILFVTKNGLVKKTPLDEYIKTKKKTGIIALGLRENDEIASINLIKDEPIILITKNGMCIKFNSSEISPTSRSTYGVKGITLAENDEVVSGLAVRDITDSITVFAVDGMGKRISSDDLVTQKRGGKGVICYKGKDIADAALLNDNDNILIIGLSKSICISAKDISIQGRTAIGVTVIKDRIQSVSKV